MAPNARRVSEPGSPYASETDFFGRTRSPCEAGGARASTGASRPTRPRSPSGSPIHRSSPSGPAISSAIQPPMVRPVTRRTSSPISQL